MSDLLRQCLRVPLRSVVVRGLQGILQTQLTRCVIIGYYVPIIIIIIITVVRIDTFRNKIFLCVYL